MAIIITWSCDVEGCKESISADPIKEGLTEYEIDLLCPHKNEWGTAHGKQYCPKHFAERVLGKPLKGNHS